MLVTALTALNATLKGLLALQGELGPALGRLEKLELTRSMFEADMQALVLKAEGKLQAAKNAEQRERQLKKSYERLVDEYDIDGPESEASEGRPVLVDDAQESEAEGVHAVRLGVAPLDGKAYAVAAKFGVGGR